MTIIKFPKVPAARPQINLRPKARAVPMSMRRRMFMGLVCTVWTIAALTWPVLCWIASMDCLFQFVRMLYYWDTPGVLGGVTFLLHFLGFTALTFFVLVSRPKWPSTSK